MYHCRQELGLIITSSLTIIYMHKTTILSSFTLSIPEITTSIRKFSIQMFSWQIALVQGQDTVNVKSGQVVSPFLLLLVTSNDHLQITTNTQKNHERKQNLLSEDLKKKEDVMNRNVEDKDQNGLARRWLLDQSTCEDGGQKDQQNMVLEVDNRH